MASSSGWLQVAFTPQHAALGGAVMGAAAVANLVLNGRTLGISGIVKFVAHGAFPTWCIALIAGLVAPAPLLATLLPSSFEALPASMTAGRTAVAGFLVGLGSVMGNGCTSGHGICGMSCLSPCSVIFVLTFMATGAFATVAFRSPAALHISTKPPTYLPLSPEETRLGLLLFVGGAVVLTALGSVWRVVNGMTGPAARPARKIVSLTSCFLCGALFSAGLALAGMTRPTKVVGFLSVTHPAWDPSLMFVMMAAIGVSIGVFQLVLGHWAKNPPALLKPLLSRVFVMPGCAIGGPIDSRLITGGIAFGAGWGLSGMCPGPALAVAIAPTAGIQVWTYIAGMLLGMASEPAVSRSLFASHAKAA